MNDKILRKLLALKEMAERGTEAEALIAAEKLQQEMIKHGIETIDAVAPTIVKYTIASGKTPTWKSNLMVVVSKGTGIPIYRYSNGQWVLIGRAEVVEAACQQYDRLLAIIERLAKPYKGTVAKNSFRRGFVSRLHDKLTPSEEGLVLIGRYKQEAEEFLGWTPPTMKKRSTAQVDRDSFLSGYASAGNYNHPTGGELNGLV